MDPRALKGAAAAAAVVLSWLFAGAAGAENPLEQMGALLPAAAERAPDVAFTTLDGREVRLRELRGRPVLLGFFTTW